MAMIDAVPVEARRRPPVWLQVFAILFLAIAERAICWNQRPPDMGLFLEPWFAHIVHYGPIQAFAHPFSNYEPAYLYLLAAGSLAHAHAATITIIKILSFLGTLFLMVAVADLLKAAGVDHRRALLVLVLPSVAINDVLLAQCDALWAGACILALAAMIRGQTLRSMVWCGVAIAFKAQAAFMAPVIIGAMIGRKAPLRQWAVPALVFLVTLVPPWLLGWPATKLLTVYLRQASGDQLAGRLANPWMLGTMFGEDAARQWFVVGYVAAGAAALTIAAIAARNSRNARMLILLGALAGTALPFLLPKMLERYYFLGDVMTLALALSLRHQLASFAMRAVQLGSILTHFTYVYFFYEPWPALIGAVFAAAGLGAMCMLAAPALRLLVSDLRAAAGRNIAWLSRPPDGRSTIAG
jgi:hypothetical protein